MRKLYLFLLSMIVATTALPVDAFTDLYIRGAQFGWNDCKDANKLTTTDGNVYTISLETLSSGFKIAAGPSWNDNYNFGSASNIEPGNSYTLTNAGNSGNITTKGGVALENVTITLTVSTRVMKVEGTAGEAKYPEALYLVGDFNGWNTSDDNYKMLPQGNNGKYVIENVSIASGKKIKFCNGSWDNNWGAANENDAIPVGTEFSPNYNGQDYTLAVALTNATVEFYYDIENIESAKVLITNGSGNIDPPTPEYPELYVRGSFTGNYAAQEAYKMTRTENVYILSGIEIPANAEFKIADNTAAWTVNFGGSGNGPDELANGVEKNAWFGSSVNFTVAKKLTDATVTFTFEGAQTGVANKIKVEGTVADDPEPEYPELYVRGSFTDNEAKEAYKMTREGNVYTLSGIEIPANGTFKIADNTAAWTVNFGGSGSGNQVLALGEETNAWFDSSVNFTVAKKLTDATVTFTFVGAQSGITNKIKVEGTEASDPEPEYPELYVRGSFTGNYAAQDAYKMTREGTVYTLSGIEIPAGAQFKIADNTTDWKVNFGGSGDGSDELANDVEKDAWFGSSVNFTVAKKLTDATVTFTYVGAESGVANKIKVAGTEASDPEPEYPELYVRGSFTNWDAQEAYKLTRNDNVYTLSGIEIPANATFKIADNTTDWKVNFGGSGEGSDELANDVEKDAWFGSSVNFTVAKKLTDATVTFTYVGAETGVVNKIKVSGTEASNPDPEYPELYVRGAFTEWAAKDAYKMTREGSVYTLSGIEIPAGEGFKIADNTEAWTVNFGGTGVEGETGEQKDTLENGAEKNAWFDSSVNFVVAKKLTNATVTFTYVGATTGVANKIKVEGTVQEDPQPEEPDLYIIGLNGDWNNFPASNKFTHEAGTTVYTLELAGMPADTNFKFCPENWGGEGEHLYVFGAESADAGKIADDKLGTTFTLKRSDTGSSNFVTSSKLIDVKITLDINYDTEVYTMKFEGTVDTDPVVLPEHPEFYLVGTFAQGSTGGWDTLPDWKFTCDESTNTYTLSGKDFDADAEFKIAPLNWEYPEIVFGAATAGQEVTFNQPINLTQGNTESSNFKFASKAEKVTLVFKYVADGTSTLTLTKEDGVEGIAYDIDSEAEYYNMQGVKVSNPDNGIYIVRRGNKVTKEVVIRR